MKFCIAKRGVVVSKRGDSGWICLGSFVKIFLLSSLIFFASMGRYRNHVTGIVILLDLNEGFGM